MLRHLVVNFEDAGALSITPGSSNYDNYFYYEHVPGRYTIGFVIFNASRSERAEFRTLRVGAQLFCSCFNIEWGNCETISARHQRCHETIMITSIQLSICNWKMAQARVVYTLVHGSCGNDEGASWCALIIQRCFNMACLASTWQDSKSQMMPIYYFSRAFRALCPVFNVWFE